MGGGVVVFCVDWAITLADIAKPAAQAQAVRRWVFIVRSFKMVDGSRVPQELKSARRAGLMAPDILEALGLARHPLIVGALRGREDAA